MPHNEAAAPSPSLLMDLRPAYEGFAGIPQETRLLFAMFAGLTLRAFGGLASGVHYTSRRIVARTPYERTLAQTQVLIAQDTKRIHRSPGSFLPRALRRHVFRAYLALSEMRRREKLDLEIDAGLFEDFIWSKLFDRTLPPQDRKLVRRAKYYVTELGHEYARSLSLLPPRFQRRLESAGWDVFFASNVSPYKRRAGHGDDDPVLRRAAAAQPAHGGRAVAARAQPRRDAEPEHGRRRAVLLRVRAGARGSAAAVPGRGEARPYDPGRGGAGISSGGRAGTRSLRTILRRRASPATAGAAARREPDGSPEA